MICYTRNFWKYFLESFFLIKEKPDACRIPITFVLTRMHLDSRRIRLYPWIGHR